MPKKLISGLLLIFVFFTSTNGYCLPAGGTVASGTATVTTAGKTTNVNQNSDKAIINWKSFNIATGETVNFKQPSAASVALNRIGDMNASTIYGALNANGRVFLINPNGILFGPGSQVNVGGLIASTLNLSDTDFLAGKYNFTGTSTASVVNQGRINAPGGYVALLGPAVENSGVILADLGSVTLASGQAATVSLDPKGSISAVVVTSPTTKNPAKKDAAIINSGTIQANGGKVVLTGKALSGIFNNLINNTGIIQADTLNNQSGVFTLSCNGNINLSGKVTATQLNLGTADNQPNNVNLSATTTIGTGGLTVNTFGTVTQVTSLNILGDFTLLNGIFNSDPTQYAFNVAKSFSLPGGSFNRYTLVIVDNQPVPSYCRIYDVYGLQAMKCHLDWRYLLANDIDASGTRGWNEDPAHPGTYFGFEPVGTTPAFSGTLDGRNYKVDGLYINRGDYIGLFGWGTTQVQIKNIGLVNCNIISGIANSNIGTLIGINYGIISNVYSSGSVTGGGVIGGLVGTNYGSISGSYTTARVEGASYVGGLVGENAEGGRITQSYATGNVVQWPSGYNGLIGGLVGENRGIISDCYASGNVDGNYCSIGGLIGGLTLTGQVSRSYATGNVTGTWCIGGLVGQIGQGGGTSISDCYATGDVHGMDDVGGLVGDIEGITVSCISNSYATGRVTAGDYTNIGGLVGYCQGNCIYSANFWDTQTSGQSRGIGNVSNPVPGVTGKLTREMKQRATFFKWDFDHVWMIMEGTTYPYFQWAGGITNNQITVNSPGVLAGPLSEKKKGSVFF